MTTKPSTILIIDDDPIVIEQLLTYFRRLNYEPIATAKSTMITQILDSFEVHLAVLDLRMEGLDGHAVLKKIRERNATLPVLIVTAYYQSEKAKLEAAGITANDVIEKPFRNFAKIEASIATKLKQTGRIETSNDFEDDIYYTNKTKVVIVDDESDIIDMFREVLEARKYEVISFAKAVPALEYIQKNDCQIAVVDMKMPELSGDQLIPKILEAKPNMQIVPISASYAPEIKNLLSQIGFDPTKLVTKPFDIYLVIEKIKQLAILAGTLGK